jgi:hypothetical protein
MGFVLGRCHCAILGGKIVNGAMPQGAPADNITKIYFLIIAKADNIFKS